MIDKKIIFLNADGNRPIEKVARRALVASGSEVLVTESIQEATSLIKRDEVDLAIVSYDKEDKESYSLMGNLFDASANIPVVIVSQKRDKEHLVELFSHDRLRNLIARNDEILEEELIITVEKLLRKDIFGMKKYFTWGVEVKEFEVRDSKKKTQLIEEVAGFTRQLRCDKRYIRLAEIISDEMIMNALYDAPVDSSGVSTFAHLPRNEQVVLSGDPAVLQIGSDGRYLGISCSDPFGALEAETVVQYLRKCFTQDDGQIDTKKGGAGVGFYMIFQSISQLIVNIEVGKRTEIIGLIDIRPMYKEIKKRTKSLNIFIKQ